MQHPFTCTTSVVVSKQPDDWVTGQNGMDKMAYGQNGIGQNGTDKMVWTKWHTDKMVLDKMVRTKWYGQNGIRTKWYWTKWYNFIFCVHFNSVEFNIYLLTKSHKNYRHIEKS